MTTAIELAKSGKLVRVDFMFGKHRQLWEILTKWSGKASENDPQEKSTKAMAMRSYSKLVRLMEVMTDNNYDSPDFPCDARFKLYERNAELDCYPCELCPLQWIDENGVQHQYCHDIFHMWETAEGERKKELARMIRDMPLKEGVENLYNIIE